MLFMFIFDGQKKTELFFSQYIEFSSIVYKIEQVYVIMII